jgi:hypothetical protein
MITITGTSGSLSATTSIALTVTASSCSTTDPIIPYIAVAGVWSAAGETSVTVASGTAVDLGPQPLSSGSWAWSGPNNFTSTAREIDNITLSAGVNVYTATYTVNGCSYKQAFTITVNGSGGGGTTTSGPVTWQYPASITYGTGLSGTQLNATASVPGSFTYSPAAFAYLGVGAQTLSVTFNPSSGGSYTATVPLTVTPATVPVDTATPPLVCTRPTPMALPSTSHVVGNGTPASCTETALSAVVASGGSITFNCGSSPVTIPITSQMTANNTTVIDGGGLITLDGGGVTRILGIAGSPVSVRNMRFINAYGGNTPGWQATSYIGTEWGQTSGAVIDGGWMSQLEVLNSVFQNNTASFSSGGAISIGSMATVTIDGSVFDSNVAGYGGAIYALVSNVAITNSTFTNNGMPYSQAGTSSIYPGFGGAFNVDGNGGSINGGPPTTSVCGTDFENNQNLQLGGAVSFWLYAPDQMIFDRDTFKNNISGNGGAMYLGLGWSDTPNTLGAVIVKNSTFISNSASSGSGGGLVMICDGGECSLTNSTFYENNASSSGSDLNVFYDPSSAWAVPTPTITVDNDTFTYGTGNSGSLSLNGSNFNIHNSVFVENGSSICSIGGFANGSNDLQYSPNGSTKDCTSGSILTANPDLATPASNGGPTETMLPASTSPLVGAGTNCESTDQRGDTRNTSKCTIGAVEVQ